MSYWITFSAHPAAAAMLAAPWRRSCRRTGGNPDSVTSAANLRVNQPGRIDLGPADDSSEHRPGLQNHANEQPVREVATRQAKKPDLVSDPTR
jgi:hypothetical protein